MSVFPAAAQRTLGRALPPWWLFLFTGIGWTIVGLIVLRFDYTSVSAVSILFGCVAIAAGVLEIFALILAAGWWKLLYGVLAFVFIAAGVVAFIHPGDTFKALAAVVSFFLVFAGTFNIIMSIAARKEISVWWVQLIAGIIELLLGFWAAGLLRPERGAAHRVGGRIHADSRRDRHHQGLPDPRNSARGRADRSGA